MVSTIIYFTKRIADFLMVAGMAADSCLCLSKSAILSFPPQGQKLFKQKLQEASTTCTGLLMTTVACKETRHLGILPYKMAIFYKRFQPLNVMLRPYPFGSE